MVPLMAMMAMTMMESMSLTAAQAVTVQTAAGDVTAAAVSCPTPEPIPTTSEFNQGCLILCFFKFFY